MARFWLATFEVPPSLMPDPPPAAPLAATGSRRFAVEFIDEGSARGVLFSSVDDVDAPHELTCVLGFVDGADFALLLRDRGYPVLDAAIQFDSGGSHLGVRCACFGDAAEMEYAVDIVAVDGVRFDGSGKRDARFDARYRQAEESPDFIDPAGTLIRRGVTWTPDRSAVRVGGKGTVDLHLKGVRSPSLAPLVEGSSSLTLNRMWSGETTLNDWKPSFAPPPYGRAARADTFGSPEFRFDDVEVVGFRLNLEEIGRDWRSALEKLVEPLNFHLQPDPGDPDRVHPDFRYRPASATLIVELLRYGRMRLAQPTAPFTHQDFQSQHELVVRVLVGRADDDSAQARDASVFVPAIFVDNPWSKMVGRDVQGFDKRMAAFCVDGPHGLRALRPNGRLVGASTPTPLLAVSHVQLVDGMDSSAGAPLLDVAYPNDGEDDAFIEIDVDVAFAASVAIPARWRQDDFRPVQFRRGFARSVATHGVRGFRSIQVAPVAALRKVGKTWIQATFQIDERVRYARPSGVARLQFHAAATAPQPWRDFCGALGIEAGDSGNQAFPTGSWYRMKLAMTMTIDDPLG
jgi:hypothetical protein